MITIKQEEDCIIKVFDESNVFRPPIQSQSVESNILFLILKKLEEIKCGLVDVKTAVNKEPVNPNSASSDGVVI